MLTYTYPYTYLMALSNFSGQQTNSGRFEQATPFGHSPSHTSNRHSLIVLHFAGLFNGP